MTDYTPELYATTALTVVGREVRHDNTTPPTSDACTTPFTLSLITATQGKVTKRLIANAHGEPIRDPTHRLGVSAGRLEHVSVAGLGGLVDLLTHITSKQVLVHGVPRGSAPGELAQLTTVERFDTERAKAPDTLILARSKAHIAYPPGIKLLMFDVDPSPEAPRYEQPADIWGKFVDIWPAFAEVGYLAASSTSSAIKRKDTGDWLRPPEGWHLYFLATGDVERWRGLAKIGLWLAGHGWCKLATPNAQTGVAAVLERCLVDLSVWSPERLDFVAGADIPKDAPFYQDRPAPTLHPGRVLDLDALPDVTDAQREQYAALVTEARERVLPQRRALVRQTILATRPDADDTTIDAEIDRRLTHAADGVLTPDHLLYFRKRTQPIRADQVTARLDTLRCADPLEPDYREGEDALFHWNGGRWCIVSWAHGVQATYRLAPDVPDTPQQEPDEPWPELEESWAEPEEPTTQRRAGEYRASARGLIREWQDAKHRTHRDPLTNFDCEVVAETTRDDGSGALRKVFDLRATVAGRVMECSVPADEFGAMRWVTQQLGARAIVMAGTDTRDHARTAIQMLSQQRITTREVFEHTGWKLLPDGTPCYLHAGGAITATGLREDITVELPGALQRYSLPEPPSGAAFCDAMVRSLDLRFLYDDLAMGPLLGGTYLAPLRPFLLPHDPPDFVLWLYGPTGSFKSEAAALCLNHYGSTFSGKMLPGSFVATANALERLCFATQDALLVVDDFHPATNRRESEAMAATVARLVRGVGNGTGRSRMHSDTTARPDLPPRGVVLATGERLPDGHSTNARMFLVNLDAPTNKEAVAARLTEAQRHREAYALAMSGYIAWLARHYTTLSASIPRRFRELRAAAQGSRAHTRQPGACAHLMLGWELFTACAHDAGALSTAERDALLSEVWRSLCDAAHTQAESLLTYNPDQMALDLLRDGLASKAIYLETRDGEIPDDAGDWGWVRVEPQDKYGDSDCRYQRPPRGTLLGYVTHDWLLLLPEPTYQYLCTAKRAAGQVFPVELKTLLKHLDEAGLLETQMSGLVRRRTVSQRVGGATPRVIKLQRVAVAAPVATAATVATAVPPVATEWQHNFSYISMNYGDVATVATKCAHLEGNIEKKREEEEKEKKKRQDERERGVESQYPYMYLSGNSGNSGNTIKKPASIQEETIVKDVATATDPWATVATPPVCPRCGAEASLGQPACAGCSALDDAQSVSPPPAAGRRKKIRL